MLSSCSDGNSYWINCCEDGPFSVDHNGILFLTESAHYESLQNLQDTLKLRQYLSDIEMKSAFDTTMVCNEYDSCWYWEYNSEMIPWDTLLMKDNFIAELVLLKDNTDNRGYYFQVRTYNNERKLISIQDFATWADKINKYCSGRFSKSKQRFSVTCGETVNYYMIDAAGGIVPRE